MYSKVNAPVLGFDLARLPGGSQLAELLLRLSRLDASGLDALARTATPEVDRASTWIAFEQASAKRVRIKNVVPSAGSTANTGSAGGAAVMAGLLEQTPLGSLDGLLRLLRVDLLGWVEDAMDVGLVDRLTGSRALAAACDAAAAAYLASHPAATDSTSADSTPTEPAPTDAETVERDAADPVAEFLRRIRTSIPAERRRVALAHVRWRTVELDWATCVHQATWAAHVTDRLTHAFEAQLALVLAVRQAGWDPAALACGDWNVLSGAVHALVVRDVLETHFVGRLLGPSIEAFGPSVAADCPRQRE